MTGALDAVLTGAFAGLGLGIAGAVVCAGWIGVATIIKRRYQYRSLVADALAHIRRDDIARRAQWAREDFEIARRYAEYRRQAIAEAAHDFEAR